MWTVFKYGIPVLGIVAFGQTAYENILNKVDAKKMGLTDEHIRMFGVMALIQTIGWAAIIIGLWRGAPWPRFVAVFNMALFLFDYTVSLPSYKNKGDKLFKFWAAGVLILMVVYAMLL